MGWKWVDDDEEDEERTRRGFGDVGRPNPNFRRYAEEDEGRSSSMRTVTRVTCRTEEVEPGRFVRKCHHTEQLLRGFIGGPPAVVESKSEHTEEDVTDEVTKGYIHLDPQLPSDPFNFPGLRSDIEGIEQRLFSSFGSFLDAAEEMTVEAFKSLRDPFSRQREESASRGPSWHQKESAARGPDGQLKDSSEQRQAPVALSD